MSKLGKYHWIALFVLIFVVFLGAVRATKPRVLVLYGTSKHSDVTHYLKRGIDEVLTVNRVPVLVRQHYMKLDAGFTLDQQDRQINEAFGMVEHFAPDVVIISGHDANKLLAPRLAELSAQPWIVPVSVEVGPEALGYQPAAQVVEVTRQLPIKGIAEFMVEIGERQPLNVAILGADTAGNQLRMKKLTQGLPGNMQVTSKLLSHCFDEWKNNVAKLSNQTALILILPTVTLQERCVPESPLLASDQFIPWLEQHARPLPVGTDVSFVKNGGAVSFYPSYNEEGDLAMNLALALTGKNHKAVPQKIETDSYQIALDPGRLKARHITVPSIYIQYGQKSGLNYRDSE